MLKLNARRRRDKMNLRLVAKHPCLICGRASSDPHHLRFAQPLGRKVSDEFTVPLCRTHHRELHRPVTKHAGGRPSESSRSPVRKIFGE